MPTISGLSHRHPRYTFFTIFLLLATFLLLASNRSPTPLYIYEVDTDIDALESRLQVSEKIYKQTLKARKELVEKFGPSPKDVMMFPPDEDPWPAYTVWDFFPATFNCPHELERIGAMGDGGKWVCGLSRVVSKPDCVVYSIGISYESSFEASVLSRTAHCQVWGYDSAAHGFGPEIPTQDRHRARFYPVGLAPSGFESDDKKLYSLETLMKRNSHDFIDILKIDIESREFETLGSFLKMWASVNRATNAALGSQDGDEMVQRPLPFGQLLIEFHAWDDKGRKFADFLKFFELLEELGLRPFRSEPNLVYANYNHEGGPELSEYSFINVYGSNVFISNAGQHLFGSNEMQRHNANIDDHVTRAQKVRKGVAE